MLWLWHRLDTIAPIQPLVQKLPSAASAAIKKEKKRKEKREEKRRKEKKRKEKKRKKRKKKYSDTVKIGSIHLWFP